MDLEEVMAWLAGAIMWYLGLTAIPLIFARSRKGRIATTRDVIGVICVLVVGAIFPTIVFVVLSRDTSSIGGRVIATLLVCSLGLTIPLAMNWMRQSRQPLE